MTIRIEHITNENIQRAQDTVLYSYIFSPLYEEAADTTTHRAKIIALEENFMRQDFKRVAMSGWNVVGFISGSILENVVGERVAIETGWYVSPGYRSTKAGPLLFEAFERWAKDANCTSICVSHYHGDTRVGNFYQRKGYTPVEVTYRKVI